MSGKGQATSPRTRPPEPGSAAPRIDRDGSAVALRLAIGRDGLGVELARPASLGCLDVVELVVRLPTVRFPFDVTGGVAKFRHRRGELERLSVEIDARRAARWAEPRLRGLLGVGACSVTIAPRAFGATVTILSPAVAERASAALAFEVALVANPELSLVVHAPRGVNVPAPATLLALRAMTALLGDSAERAGSRFVLARAAGRLARALLPDAGFRAPYGDDVALQGSGESDGVLFLAFARGADAPGVPEVAALASEAALLAERGDDARASGDLARARHLDLSALERAPRHAEISRRLAELDAHAGGRAEAAIATLREIDRPLYLGSLLGDLLAEAGDDAAAIAALLREGERDPSAPIAALAWARAASLAADPADALAWLDAAVARAPQLAELRWERATRRLLHGRIKDARADFQHLEALARGPRDRFEALRRAGDIHRARGLGADAALLYERALLYRPDDPEALAGLGAAIAAEGRAARGAALLARAIDLASASVPPRGAAWMELELGRVLAERLGDLPAAVARLRAVPDEAPEAIAARGLEGRYRATLGDVTGASLAFARMRERAGREPSALPWLEEAAGFEETRGDWTLAQAHLSAALAVSGPHATAELTARYRAVSEQVARAAGVRALPEEAPRHAAALVAESVERPRAEPPTPEEDEARVEALTRMLQGDPTNDAVVDELTERLTRLGRSMELLALLSARLEDAPPERRAELLPRHREVLERLEHEARAAGRDGEADLFRMARDAS